MHILATVPGMLNNFSMTSKVQVKMKVVTLVRFLPLWPLGTLGSVQAMYGVGEEVMVIYPGQGSAQERCPG